MFNEFPSEDGSVELGRNVVVQSGSNDCDSSNSPCYNNSCNVGLKGKHESRLDNELYRIKCAKLKKLIKGLVFINASLCDEVSHLQEKILIAKEERRFLLRKLLNFEAQKDNCQQTGPAISIVPSVPPKVLSPETGDFLSKKKSCVKKKPPQRPNKESFNKARSKKKKPACFKRVVQPIPLDSCGRPVFPILLGSLTVHSLGVIIPDRPGFHNEHHIFPAGYCSSRTYLSIKDPAHQCLYTCTIVDASYGPRFEIIPEDDPEHPLVGNSASECHRNLLKAVYSKCGKEVVTIEGQGARFFGISHPTVQNLIQSCAGARKCASYRWVHFEVSKEGSDVEEDLSVQEFDSAVNPANLNIAAESSVS